MIARLAALERDDGEVAGTKLTQTMVIVGKHLWVGGETFAAMLPEGKRWIQADQAALPELGSMTFDELMAFCAAATDIEKRGETEIDGVRVTHYAGTVDYEAAAEKLGQDANAYKQRFDGGEAKMPIEAWLDASGNAVRVKVAMDMGSGEVEMTMDGFEYDVDTSSIKAPPAGETISDDEVGIFSQS